MSKKKAPETGYYFLFLLTDDEKVEAFGPGETYAAAARVARAKAQVEADIRGEHIDMLLGAGSTRESIGTETAYAGSGE